MKKTSHLILPTLLFAGSMLLPHAVYASINLAPPSLDDPYYLGQLTYQRKLSCGTCPLSETTLDVKKAKEFVKTLETDEKLKALLTEKEREAVTHYLEVFFHPAHKNTEDCH